MPDPTDPVGPYERWMYGPGRTYDLPGLMLADQSSISAVAELPAPAGAAALPALLAAYDHITLHPRLPILYRPGQFQPRFLPFLLSPLGGKSVMDQDPANLASLLSQLSSSSGATGQIRLNFPLRAETISATYPTSFAPIIPDPEVDRCKPIVILAVIDHGIPFAHKSLRTATSTRVEFCWSQSAEADQSGTTLFGREFRRTEIDAARDEDATYRAAGLLGRPGLPPMPLARLHSHGAHVLGSMAGSWPTDQAAQVRIIAVDLPATTVWDTSGFGSDMVLLSALHYIFDRAEKIAAAYDSPDCALVIILSYGTSGGPHDGTGLIGAAFDEMIRYRRALAPTALVLPSGNMFQDRLHARIDPGHFTPDANLQWFAPPADRTSSFIELWYPPGTDPAQIKLTLTPPNGLAPDASLTLGPGPARQDMTLSGKIVGQLQIDQYRNSLWRVTIILAPSEPKALPPGQHGGLPAGNLDHHPAKPLWQAAPWPGSGPSPARYPLRSGQYGCQAKLFRRRRLRPFLASRCFGANRPHRPCAQTSPLWRTEWPG